MLEGLYAYSAGRSGRRSRRKQRFIDAEAIETAELIGQRYRLSVSCASQRFENVKRIATWARETSSSAILIGLLSDETALTGAGAIGRAEEALNSNRSKSEPLGNSSDLTQTINTGRRTRDLRKCFGNTHSRRCLRTHFRLL